MSSSDSANRPKGPQPATSSAGTASRRNGNNSNSSNGRNGNSSSSSNAGGRRRGGPGGPVPVTVTSTNPRASNPLHLDLSGLRIDNDTESIASSSAGTNTTGSSSRRRRRRRNNKNALQVVEGGTGFGRIPPIPSSSKTGGKGGGKKPAKLQIGLNLDVELELKAKLGGDLTLSMVLEDRPKKRNCPELPMPGEGECVATELFYMRVGTLRFRRRWIDPDAVLRGQIFLTALSAAVLLAGGFVLGWAAATAAAGGRGGGGGYGRGGVDVDVLPEVSFGRGLVDESSVGLYPHERLVSVSSSSSSSSWQMDGEEDDDGLALDGGAGAGCRCDCELVRQADGGLLDLRGIDLALGSSLGNVSFLYKY